MIQTGKIHIQDLFNENKEWFTELSVNGKISEITIDKFVKAGIKQISRENRKHSGNLSITITVPFYLAGGDKYDND